MTSTNPTPHLLPGLSSNSWARVLAVVSWLCVPAAIVAFGSQFFHWSQHFTFDWFVPLFADLGLTLLVLLFATLRNRKEIAAGYTTSWRSNPTVPQLDATTGEVIREAGQPYVTRADWRSRDGARIVDSSPDLLSKPTLGQRILPALPGFVVILAAIVISSVYGRVSQGFGQVFGLSFAAFLVVLLVVIYAILGGIASARLRRMRLAAPDDFVFIFGSNSRFTRAAADLRPADASFPSGPFGGSANSSGITLWEGNPPERLASLTWDRVTSIQADRVASGNTWRAAILMSYRNDDGAIKAMELMGANADRLEFRSMPEVRWIASELNALRTAKTQARTI